MLDPNKIRTMTKLAIMEEEEGTEMMKRISHRKIDYVFTGVFKGFVAGSVCFIIAMLLWFFYLWDDLNDFIVNLDFMQLMKDIGFRYLIFIAIYVAICAIVAFRTHTKGMQQRYIYLSYLKRLKSSYDQDRRDSTRRGQNKTKRTGNDRAEREDV
ncbi:MAG: hypothetical protein LIO56_03075 [Lachnospiraceae bacterium]|nr:hypothetical protein [Lachnospiraceae bacterium]